MAPTLAIDADRLAAFCRRHAVRRLSLFGSYLRGSQEDDSDIDLLVEFLASATPTLLDLAGMEAELSQLLEGRPVDLRTPMELSPRFRDEVLRQAVVQYAA